MSHTRLCGSNLDAIAAAVNAATPGSYTEVEIPFKLPSNTFAMRTGPAPKMLAGTSGF